MKCKFGDHNMISTGGSYYVCYHDDMYIIYNSENDHAGIKQYNPSEFKGDVIIQFNDKTISWFNHEGEWKYQEILTDQIMAMEPKKIFDMFFKLSNFI